MNIQAHVMAQSMHKNPPPPLPQRRPVRILAVRIDVIERELLQSPLAATRLHPRLHRRDRRLLRAQHDLVNLLLPSREFPIHRNRPSHVGSVIAALRAHVHHYHLARIHLPLICRIMQDHAIRPAPDNRSIRIPFASPMLK